MSLLAIIPRPARIKLGGRLWLASEFRLGDLAELQEWLGLALPDPFDAAAWRLQAGSRDAAWKRLLAATIDARESYPPTFGDAAAGRLLDSPAGVQAQLRLSLRREHPRFDHAAAESLHAALTVAEYRRFTRAAWGIDPARTLVGLVDGPRPAGDPPDWPALWHRYVTTVKGPAPPFADLTITQLRAWRCGGVLDDGTAAGPDWRAVAHRRAEFWAEVADETQPPEVQSQA